MQITDQTIQHFAAYLQAGERAPATIEKYCREMRQFSTWLDGREADKPLIRAYKDELAEKRSSAGVNGAVAALNALFTFLKQPEYLLKAVRVQRRIFRDEARELTEKEYRSLLSAAKRRRNERLLVMEAICATGIRVSELRFFTVEAVRLGQTEVSNKGKTRTVSLPGKLQKVMLRYARMRGIVSGPVFVTRAGRPLDRSNIWHDMKALCQEAGVAETKVFPHNLRHLFARTFYRACRDVVKLADVLGHSSIETTRIYLISTGAEHAKQLEKLGLVT